MEFNRFGNMMPPEEYRNRPYLMYRDPFQIAGNLYFVGNEWCSSHLIDTGEGLILLDTPAASGFPGLISNICKLGFRLADLKYIVVSHAHADHYGCVRALVHITGAKTFLGAVDAKDMAENPDRMEEMNRDIGPYNECFIPDVLLEDGDVKRASELAEKIRAAFASIAYETAGCQTVSIGVTQTKAGETYDTLCSRVDKALYTAKARGKNQVIVL